ncbi:ECF-type sigma factor [Nitrososphaera viennensis]|uniref:RNA polymerase sigma-70 ECF-like HTH domain-containing protein n=2 Tax=Nitrososphaera viennensis TaxID=1034015 RepID=A0A060HG66_9ARCH|nr:ECF-type sigma factor [Nitrososphaera viennensis]AIC14598.1 hypothetical protein NVIE_004050 [Nitrososphaera viennensis EN76]UVS69564.1 ECF-type sigma factor [Nitrososphaera viennensis]
MMASENKEVVNVDPWILKRLARMYESGLSIKEISEQLDIGARSVKRILGLLGYVVAD